MLRLLPWAVIGAAIVYDTFVPPSYTAAPLLASAPLLAAPFYSWPGTLGIGLTAIAAQIGLHVSTGSLGSPRADTETATVLFVTGLAVLVNRIIFTASRRLASARQTAATVQRAVLPLPPRKVAGFEVAARYEPAATEALIGGDLYAVQETPYGVRLLIGDVQGKGLDAVAEVAVAIGAFRVIADTEPSLCAAADSLDRTITRESTRRAGPGPAESFITAVLCEIPPGRRTLRIVNRGHPPPLLLDPDGTVHALQPTHYALPLGTHDLTGDGDANADGGGGGDHTYDTSDTYDLQTQGCLLLLFTDGLTEARDRQGVFYDPARRLAARRFTGPDALLDHLVADVRHHTGQGVTDDLALLALALPSHPRPPRDSTTGAVLRRPRSAASEPRS
ncbi:PP2C family protein-serine/threonine phosphatase [Streptomyces sp. NPDC048290]|uniref:PP2C family protein-serine/threonine phosphatase n=1 Tax=Streptomyces sp. NPDC048290 TaxID=3155811 RepID=UPI0034431AD0